MHLFFSGANPLKLGVVFLLSSFLSEAKVHFGGGPLNLPSAARRVVVFDTEENGEKNDIQNNHLLDV